MLNKHLLKQLFDSAVIKRLETAQINLSDVPNKDHLLNISKSYRAQQEKAKHLESQVKLLTAVLNNRKNTSHITDFDCFS